MFARSKSSGTHNPTVRSVESDVASHPIVQTFTSDKQSHVTGSIPKRSTSEATYSSIHYLPKQQDPGRSLSGVTTRKRKSIDASVLAASELSKLLQAAATCSIDASESSQEHTTSTTASRRGSHLTPPVSAEPQAEQRADTSPRQETKRRRSQHNVDQQPRPQPVVGPAENMITTTRRSCGAVGSRRDASRNPAPPAANSERPKFQPPRIVGMTPAKALQVFSKQLTEYERNEIKQYSPVWFVGPRARKIHAVEGMGNNCGYDDANTRLVPLKGRFGNLRVGSSQRV